MNVVILGATKGMGRALARQMVERGDSICLLGRNIETLEKSKKDLMSRGSSAKVFCVQCDLAQPDTFSNALNRAKAHLKHIDCIVVTAAVFAPQAKLEQDSALTEKLLTLNFTNTIVFCEAAKKILLTQKGGTLCVFSSVAGERGRKPVVLYGASKAGLSKYLEGLDHKHRADGLKVITVKPGFVRTSMTAGLKPPPFAGEPEQVAKTVLKGIDKGTPIIYAPKPWKGIMAVIRHLPRQIMRRVSF